MEKNVYVLRPGLARPPSFITIAQRLLSGRLCIADAVVEGTRDIFAQTLAYASKRPVFVGPTETVSLADLPVFSHAMADHAAQLYVHTVRSAPPYFWCCNLQSCKESENSRCMLDIGLCAGCGGRLCGVSGTG